MKKAILILFPIIVLVGAFLILKTENPSDVINSKKVPLEIKDNTIQCPICNMYIVGKDYTAQAVTSEGKTHFFDDPGCLVLWIEQNAKDDKNLVSWVYTVDSKKWIKLDTAFFSIDDDTPMHHRFGAYEKDFKRAIGFAQMKLRLLRGEDMTNPKIRKKILEERE